MRAFIIGRVEQQLSTSIVKELRRLLLAIISVIYRSHFFLPEPVSIRAVLHFYASHDPAINRSCADFHCSCVTFRSNESNSELRGSDIMIDVLGLFFLSRMHESSFRILS